MFKIFLQIFFKEHFFPTILVCVFVSAILYFVWKSTQVREIPVATLPFNTNFGKTIFISKTILCHNVNICLVRRSSSVVSNISTVSASTTVSENLAESSVENITDQILAEASENYNENSSPESSPLDNDITEEEQLIREMDRDLPSTSESSGSLRHRITSVELTDEPNEEEKISIKLKYINDDIKIVNGYLNETLASFKR